MMPPKKSLETLKFEEENSGSKQLLSEMRRQRSNLGGSALKGIDPYLIKEFNQLAECYNDSLIKAGGQSGFGFSMLKQEEVK